MDERVVLFGDELGLDAIEQSLGKEEDFAPVAVVYSSGRTAAEPIAKRIAFI